MTAGLTTPILAAAEAAVAEAARCLRAGGLVAFPTETVYGLGADATNAAAVARLYDAKGRPSFNPLIAHVADLAAARRIARFDAQRRAARGGVLAGAADAGAAEGARLPGGRPCHRRPRHHRRARARASGGARHSCAPSASRWWRRRPIVSGHVSPTTAAHVQSDLAGRIDLIVDGGAVEVGVESTIVGCFDGRCCCAPAACRAARSSACSAARLLQPPDDADSDAAARAGHAGVALCAAHAGAAQRDSGRGRRGAARVRPVAVSGVDKAAAVLNSLRARRSRRGGRQSFRPSSRARRQGRARHRGDADPESRARRSHQRPAAPRRRGAGMN